MSQLYLNVYIPIKCAFRCEYWNKLLTTYKSKSVKKKNVLWNVCIQMENCICNEVYSKNNVCKYKTLTIN